MIRYALLAWLTLSASLHAANVRWVGAAQDVRQVSTIAVTGTWATGDTATLTINNKSVTVTIGASASTSNVADVLARAVDAANSTEDLLGDESRNFGGEEIPEFAEIDASASGATLTLTSEVPGVPFTVTRSESTAGDGALGAVTSVTAATGKNWLNNAANYDGGAVPVDNDTLYIDSGDVDIRYALDHFRSNNIDLNIYVSNDWTGQLGLPSQNAGGYREYRSRYFQMRGLNLYFTPGKTNATGQGACWVDLQDQTPVVEVWASRGDGRVPTINLAGGHATDGAYFRIYAGGVSLEPDDAPSASSKHLIVDTVQIGNKSTDATQMVWVGRNSRFETGATVEINGGHVVTYANTDGVTAAVKVTGGTLELRTGVDDCESFEVYSGATLKAISLGDCAGVELFSGATFDARESTTNFLPTGGITAHAGANIFDPNGHYLGRDQFTTLTTKGCSIGDLGELQLPPDRVFEFDGAAP